MENYNQLALRIIREQEQLMGPMAWFEAGKVQGLQILDQEGGKIAFLQGSDSKAVVNNLVEQYSSLFGRAALEVCKESVAAIIADMSPSEIPSSLK
jgi:hypothetical protein